MANVPNETYAAIYVRVSTADQHTGGQEDQLRDYASRRGWRIHKVYADRGVSGGKSKRPALDELMADCRKRKIDVVLVWKFDRFARSVAMLITALETFNDQGIQF